MHTFKETFTLVHGVKTLWFKVLTFLKMERAFKESSSLVNKAGGSITTLMVIYMKVSGKMI